jgi:hypothetical protein
MRPHAWARGRCLGWGVLGLHGVVVAEFMGRLRPHVVREVEPRQMEAPLCPHEGFLGHAHEFCGGVQTFRCSRHSVVKTVRASRGVHRGSDA